MVRLKAGVSSKSNSALVCVMKAKESNFKI